MWKRFFYLFVAALKIFDVGVGFLCIFWV